MTREHEMPILARQRDAWKELCRQTQVERDEARAQVKRLQDALHEAEAIGDFPSELRDRLALKEAAACVPVLVAERDEARAQVEALAKERDGYKAELTGAHVAQRECQETKAQVARLQVSLYDAEQRVASERALRHELKARLSNVEQRLAWAGYHQQAPTLAECIAVMYQDLVQAREDRDTFRVQVELLAGALSEVVALCPWSRLPDPTPASGIIRLSTIRRASQALSSLPAAGEKWAAMAEVRDMAVTLFSDCSAASPESGPISIHDSCGACDCGVHAACEKRPLKQALQALAKEVQP